MDEAMKKAMPGLNVTFNPIYITLRWTIANNPSRKK